VPDRAGINAELVAIAEEAHLFWVWSGSLASSHFASHKLWRYVGFLTTGLAAVLAAVTGVSALADLIGTKGVGVASLVTAVLAGLGGLARANDRATSGVDAGNTYAKIRDDLRQFLLIDLAHMDYDAARERLAQLTERYHEANRSTQPPLSWPYALFSHRVNPALGYRITGAEPAGADGA
jgi:hypothetical protein